MSVYIIPCQRNRIRKNGMGLFLILRILHQRGSITGDEMEKAIEYLASTEEMLNEPDCRYRSVCPVSWANWLFRWFQDEENEKF